MGGVLDKDGSPEASAPKTKLEAKIFQAVRRREVQGSSTTAFNSIILKFPKIDESFRKCRSTFEEFGKCYLRCACFYGILTDPFAFKSDIKRGNHISNSHIYLKFH